MTIDDVLLGEVTDEEGVIRIRQSRPASPPRTFAQFLRQERERLGLSQRDVAKLIGASSATVIAQWEQGLGQPRLLSLVLLGNSLGQRTGGWDWNEVLFLLGAKAAP